MSKLHDAPPWFQLVSHKSIKRFELETHSRSYVISFPDVAKIEVKKQNVWWVSSFFWYGGINRIAVFASPSTEKRKRSGSCHAHTYSISNVWINGSGLYLAVPSVNKNWRGEKTKIYTSREARIDSLFFFSFSRFLFRLRETKKKASRVFWTVCDYCHGYLSENIHCTLELTSTFEPIIDLCALLLTSLYMFFFFFPICSCTAQNTCTWE